jgi:hypothetical protein
MQQKQEPFFLEWFAQILGRLSFPHLPHHWELMKSVVDSHGSSSLLFAMKVMMVWHFVSNSHKVMTAPIVVLPSDCCCCGDFLFNFAGMMYLLLVFKFFATIKSGEETHKGLWNKGCCCSLWKCDDGSSTAPIFLTCTQQEWYCYKWRAVDCERLLDSNSSRKK